MKLKDLRNHMLEAGMSKEEVDRLSNNLFTAINEDINTLIDKRSNAAVEEFKTKLPSNDDIIKNALKEKGYESFESIETQFNNLNGYKTKYTEVIESRKTESFSKALNDNMSKYQVDAKFSALISEAIPKGDVFKEDELDMEMFETKFTETVNTKFKDFLPEISKTTANGNPGSNPGEPTKTLNTRG